jgi:hypothetical protein
MALNTVLAFVGVCAVICASCSNESRERVAVTEPAISEKEVLKIMENKKIFFGHQSVGDNILDGVEKIRGVAENANIRIVEYNKSNPPDGPALAHAHIGRNQFPDLKIQAFSEYVRGGVGNWADVALFKLCYVDITSKTDVKAVFNMYREAMGALKSEYPQTTFVHVTVPLVCRYQGWKDMVKRILGRKLGSDDDNIRRNEYNQMLLAEYQGKEPIFDLAQAESTREDGTRETFTVNGRKYHALVAEYASDGAHLNDLGKRRVAEQFLSSLARAARNN